MQMLRGRKYEESTSGDDIGEIRMEDVSTQSGQSVSGKSVHTQTEPIQEAAKFSQAVQLQVRQSVSAQVRIKSDRLERIQKKYKVFNLFRFDIIWSAFNLV